MIIAKTDDIVYINYDYRKYKIGVPHIKMFVCQFIDSYLGKKGKFHHKKYFFNSYRNCVRFLKRFYVVQKMDKKQSQNLGFRAYSNLCCFKIKSAK